MHAGRSYLLQQQREHLYTARNAIYYANDTKLCSSSRRLRKWKFGLYALHSSLIRTKVGVSQQEEACRGATLSGGFI